MASPQQRRLVRTLPELIWPRRGRLDRMSFPEWS
jgi:hypothetical protein